MAPRPAATGRAPGAGGEVAAAVPFAWSAWVGAAFGALYLALAPAVTGPKDAAEFTLVLALNGVPHPTGYPLYVLLGHPFVLLLHALGASWAYASNAWSAVGGAVAIALLHALALRLIPARAALGRVGRFALACVPVAILGVNPVWLLDAIFAETYTWHLAWMCGTGIAMLGLMRSWEARSSAADREGAGAKRLARAALLWGLLCGVGLAHHRTALIPVAVFSAGVGFALLRSRRARPALLVPALAGLLLPQLAYGFVAWRAFHPAPYQWAPLEPSWQSAIEHVFGSAYGDLLGTFAPDAVQRALLADHAFPVLFPALALIALACLFARGAERLALATLAATAVAQTLYAFNYGVRDPSCYFEPPMALALLGVPVVGAMALARGGAPAPRALAVAAAVAALAGFAALGVRGLALGQSIRAGAIETDRRMRATWDRIPPGPGFVLWDHDMASTFQVYQRLEGRRPELMAANPATLSWPAPRRAFRERFGFDPLAGLEPLTAARALEIPSNINRQTPLPVAIFDLHGQQVVTLPKPAAAGTPGDVVMAAEALAPPAPARTAPASRP